MERIMSMVNSLNFGARIYWIAGLKELEVDIFVALAILQSSNLRRLRLDNDYYFVRRFISAESRRRELSSSPRAR